MTIWLKQSTSVDVPIGPFVDATDGVTAETALTITQPDIRLKKNAAAWGQKNAAQTLSHEENGYYEVTLDATDTDTLGRLRVAVNETGALPVWQDFMVVAANVYDSLIGGGDTLDVQVTGIGANVITASSIAADAITDAKVASDVTIASVTGSVGSVTGAVGSVTGNVGGSVASVTGSVGSVTGSVGGNVLGNVSGSVASVAAGGITSSSFAADAITAAVLAADVTTELQTGLATSAALATAQADLDDIQTRLPAALVGGRMDASVGAMAVGVTVTTNNDKTGYGLSGAAVQAIWDALTSALTTVGSIGKLIVDNLNATVSSRLPTASYVAPLDAAATRAAVGLASANLDTQLDALPTAAENADAVWDEVLAGHLTAGSTGNALNAAGSAGDPWSTALPGAYGAGTAGKIIGDNINATISSRATQTSVDAVDDFVDTEITDIQNRLPAALVGGRMDASVGAMQVDVLTASALAASAVTEIQAGLSTLDAAGVRTAVGLASANLDTQLDALPTSAENADAVWDEALSGHAGVGSTGAALSAAGGSGDPWSTALPGAYGAGTAGNIIGNRLDAAVSSRAVAGDAMALTGGERTTLAGVIWGTVMEGTRTAIQYMRGFGSTLLGKASGMATTTAVFRDVDDTKPRVTATVDADGNRTAVTLDLT